MTEEQSPQVNLVERNKDLQIVVNRDRIAKQDPQDLVELAQQIQSATIHVKNNAYNKLIVIAEQVKFLQKQAQRILQEADENAELHRIACNFKKIPGKIYHLYEKESTGHKYFGMLSPDEWSTTGGPKDKYLGSWRLENDQSWTSVEQISQQEQERRWAENLISGAGKKKKLLAIEELNVN